MTQKETNDPTLMIVVCILNGKKVKSPSEIQPLANPLPIINVKYHQAGKFSLGFVKKV